MSEKTATSRVISVRRLNQDKATYDLTVARHHNFFSRFTGTPTLNHNCIVKDIIGPVTARCEVETLVPEVRIIETQAATSKTYNQWHHVINYLANHKQRNAQIVKYVEHDLKEQRSILIPVVGVKHAHTLVEMINKRCGANTAVAFVGQGMSKKQRREFLEKARSYKIKVVVGIRKIVQQGVNVPRWDTLYEVMPISNPPKAKQETSRIRTDDEGKQSALIRVFIENFGPSKGCFRTLYWQTFVKEGFRISPKQRALAEPFLRSSRGRVTDTGIV